MSYLGLSHFSADDKWGWIGVNLACSDLEKEEEEGGNRLLHPIRGLRPSRGLYCWLIDPPKWPLSQIDKKNVSWHRLWISVWEDRVWEWTTSIKYVKLLAAVRNNLIHLSSGSWSVCQRCNSSFPCSSHHDSDHQSPETGFEAGKTNKDTHSKHLQLGWSRLPIHSEIHRGDWGHWPGSARLK